ncbi:LPS-assembly lipoprotein [Mycoplana sp. BE70]|uniref:LPS assembly lipoprotein LptE n=1 Tax=Mycoplana sp. BE70 TaxID=2817775 RepID=UPI00285A5A81|nr:LPS assembly lipoprotein LptE [Mycoplana sp. BE70]MDR6755879.1 LPS-assembly lipoprotein [Mycoplana sp. BE70]
MLLSDGRSLKFAISAIGLLALTVTAGCQVRPLHSTGSAGAGAAASVSVSEADDRVEQRVRNELIFLLGGGAGEPTAAAYHLELSVASRAVDVLVSSSDDVARAGRIVMTADYNLTRSDSGETIRSGRRQVVALVDFPVQEFAKLRAIRDAENRAARELAELLRADIATGLAKR